MYNQKTFLRTYNPKNLKGWKFDKLGDNHLDDDNINS